MGKYEYSFQAKCAFSMVCGESDSPTNGLGHLTCFVTVSNVSSLKGTRNRLLFGFKYRPQFLKTILKSLKY